MVLHGGSGIPKEQVIEAIKLGISKINVNTECQIVFSNALKNYYAAKNDEKDKGFDPRKVLANSSKAIKDIFVELTG
jgi:fructose-bisphosphate aldolase class II